MFDTVIDPPYSPPADKMITVPTEEGGTLTIAAEELKAATVRTVWNERERLLQVVIVWHDNGLPGHPQITIEEGDAIVTIRPEEEEMDDVLSRANRLADHLCGVD